ncbi:hypothetical protein N665_5605s0002 [Sinapis alba]|nr:hypothetical protein N665_5605s0002 [Sinapis alba]
MKTSGAIKIFLLMIYLLLVAITSSGVVAGEEEEVLDTDGYPVVARASYLIDVRGPEGKLWVSQFECSQRVVSISDEIEEGPLPVSFELSYDREVTVSTELKIKFELSTECGESGYWRVASSSSSSPTKEIDTSGSESSDDTTFTIMKTGKGDYKFAFVSADKPTDIGLDKISSGVWRLILSNNSVFGVSFIPFSSTLKVRED